MSLVEDVCPVIKMGRHQRLARAEGVTVNDVGAFGSLKEGWIAAHRWVQAQVPEQMRKHVGTLYASPDAADWPLVPATGV